MRELRKTFRYRIYPTAAQIERLLAWEDALRFLWNLAHEQRRLGLARARCDRRYYTAFDQINQLTELRAELSWLADVPRNVSAQLLVELDKTWQRAFKKLARAPRWKKRGRDTLGLCEPHPKTWRLEDGAIVFPKLRRIRAVIHRPLEGLGKTCSIIRDGDQWFACISAVVTVADAAPPTGPPVALDRGIANLVGDSTGRLGENPRYLAQHLKRLARAQRVVARRKKGSRNREKARRRVAKLHRKIRRQRDHHLHHVANYYAKNHGTVIIEKLAVKNMTRSARGTKEQPGKNVRQKAGLNRAILDAGWGKLVTMLRYKCNWAGGTLLAVPAAYSSQTCAVCGHVASESRQSQSLFVCAACKHQDHADINAAKVLLSRGIHGGTVCGGSAEVRRPAKQKLRASRRGTRPQAAWPKASSFTSG